MDETLKRQILARLYGPQIDKVTALHARPVRHGDDGVCWRGPGLEYWPAPGEFVVCIDDIAPLIHEKLAVPFGYGLIHTAAGREAWKRLGCPMPGELA